MSKACEFAGLRTAGRNWPLLIPASALVPARQYLPATARKTAPVPPDKIGRPVKLLVLPPLALRSRFCIAVLGSVCPGRQGKRHKGACPVYNWRIERQQSPREGSDAAEARTTEQRRQGRRRLAVSCADHLAKHEHARKHGKVGLTCRAALQFGCAATRRIQKNAQNLSGVSLRRPYDRILPPAVRS